VLALLRIGSKLKQSRPDHRQPEAGERRGQIEAADLAR
jgi:hypothetical protein